jgi:hypothetical protein
MVRAVFLLFPLFHLPLICKQKIEEKRDERESETLFSTLDYRVICMFHLQSRSYKHAFSFIQRFL